MTSVLPRHRSLILASIMASNFMIAVESTIVATAMPQIAAQLGNLNLYSWVFSAFLLGQTAATVVFGKLADIYGRKHVLLVGLAIFLAGSLLCGFAWSMLSLVGFRLIQGFGAGAVQPVTMTIIGDLYPGHQRGRVQGWLASVWGVSSVLGPLAGGLIVERMSWGWVFWINLPVGLAAGVGFLRYLNEDREHHRRSVDVAGALLFTIAISALMIALTEGSHAGLGIIGALLGACAVAGVLFVRQERRAPEPMIAFGLWGRRVMASVNAVALFSGMVQIGLTTFLPMYVQAVMQRSALVAGLTFTAIVLGWPIAATFAARNFARLGLRRTLIIGAALLPLGAVPFVVIGPGSSPLLAGFGSLVVGSGMGFLSTASIVIVQDSVGWAERGVATAANLFARNLGSTLGAAALGGLLNWHLAHGRVPIDAERVRGLIDHHAALGDAATRLALAGGLNLVFWGLFTLAALALAVSLLVPHVAFAVPPADAIEPQPVAH